MDKMRWYRRHKAWYKEVVTIVDSRNLIHPENGQNALRQVESRLLRKFVRNYSKSLNTQRDCRLSLQQRGNHSRIVDQQRAFVGQYSKVPPRLRCLEMFINVDPLGRKGSICDHHPSHLESGPVP